jgi:hypothetical protein
MLRKLNVLGAETWVGWLPASSASLGTGHELQQHQQRCRRKWSKLLRKLVVAGCGNLAEWLLPDFSVPPHVNWT